MQKKISFLILLGFFVTAGYFLFIKNKDTKLAGEIQNFYVENLGGPIADLHPLSISTLRKGEYPGSEITIEQTLPDGSNYFRYIASYRSDGLKIYALLTVPKGEMPEGGFPVVIFNHGYIPPVEYRTTERYAAYTDAFSRNGYVLFRSDYRGHGNSEGKAEGGYGTNAYTIDILNAISSVKKLKDPENPSTGSAGSIVNADRIGMWGHSMGGHITMRAMVTDTSIKAGNIWAGVVGPYPDPFLRNQGSNLNPNATPRPTRATSRGGSWRNELIQAFGNYETNKEFWDSLSAVGYLKDLSGPVQLHHGTNDSSVPVEVSEYLEPMLEANGKNGGVYIYPGDDHNLTNSFSLAMNRTIEFFDKYLK